jgi:hypothetical protein
MKGWGTVTQQFSDGPYSIDVDRMWKLYYDRRRTENYSNSRFCPAVPADPHSDWFGPDVKNLEVNWDAAAADARQYADTTTAATCYKLSSREIRRAQDLRVALKNEYAALESARYKFTDRLQQNGRANNAALQRNLLWKDLVLTGLKGTRDTSATLLAVGATVLTAGGAAGAGLLVTGVGAGLTGTAKAQDNERLTTQQAVGVAVVSGSFDFVTTVVTGGISKGVKMGKLASAAVGFFVKVPTKTATSIMMAEMTRRKDEPAEGLGHHAWEVTKEEAIDAATDAIADKFLELPGIKRVVRGLAVAAANVVKSGANDAKGGVAAGYVRRKAKDLVTNAQKTTVEVIVRKGAPKDPLPEAVIRQPVHGGAGLEYHVLLAILSPLSSRM